MKTLANNPFNLVFGDFIIARVSARNDKGMGESTQEEIKGDGTRMINQIPSTPTLSLDSKSATWIKVKWESSNQELENQTYELMWNEGGKNTAYKLLKKTSDTSHTQYDLKGGENFKFKVR